MTILGWKMSTNMRGIQTLNRHSKLHGQLWALDWIGSHFICLIRGSKSQILLFRVLDQS